MRQVVQTSSGKIVRGLKSTYKRHGTINLFAALNVASGVVQSKTTATKKRPDFQAFMEEVVADIPTGKAIHVILDNYSTHKKNHDWLAEHPNVRFHYTLSAAALDVLQHQRGKHDVWVFPYRNKPVTQVATRAWREAIVRAGIGAGFRWHDLRHTWASWHAQDGTPLHVLQESGAWAGAEMIQRYAHLSTEHLAHWVKRRTGLDFPSVSCDNFPTLEKKSVH